MKNESHSKYSARRARRKFYINKVSWARIVLGIIIVLTYFIFIRTCDMDFDKRVEKLQYPFSELMKVQMPEGTPEILKDYEGFTVSFNPVHHVPNYVVWELTRDELRGQEPRKNDFHEDFDIEGCPTLEDYRRSGFDRGHMAPAGEMKWSSQAMFDSHVLTNMCPQDHNVNGGRWKSLEQLEQSWVETDSALIIFAGPILTDEITRHIGESNVSVPERFFRIVFAPYSDPPSAVAFIVPNMPVQEGPFRLAVSIDEIEAATGMDFFSILPDDIETELERQPRANQWKSHK